METTTPTSYRFTFRFVGCLAGAIGLHYPIEATRTAETQEQAELMLYDKYDHIQRLYLLHAEPVNR
jgi:hypothetical protein